MANRIKQSAELRKRAEAVLLEATPENITHQSPEEIQKTVFSLRVHQIELEMQNEELRQTQAALDVSWKRYFDFYNLAPVGYFTISPEGLILEANLIAASFLGLPQAKLINQPLTNFVHQQDQDLYYLFRKKLLGHVAPQNCELRVVRKDGAVLWAQLHAIAAQDADGSPVCRLVLSDITERKAAEEARLESEVCQHEQEALRISEAQFREVLEHSLDASYKRNLLTQSYDYLSPVFTQLSGYTPDEMMTFPIETVLGFIHRDDMPEVERALTDSMADVTESLYQLEYRFKHKDGQYRWFHDRFTVLRDEGGHPVARIGSVSDITRRKYTDEKLQQTMQEQKTILDTANVGIFSVVDRKQLWLNQKVVDLFQYSREEMEGQTTRKLYPTQEAYEQFGRKAYSILALGQVYETEQKMIRRDGSPVWMKWNGRAVDPQDLSKGSIWIAEDTTQFKQVAEALEDQRLRLVNIIEATHVGTWEWNVQTGETVFNERWAQMIGYLLADLPTATIKTWEMLAHPDDLQQSAHLLARHFAGELPFYECECRMQHRDGHWIWVHDRGCVVTRTKDGEPLMMFGTHLDITERKHIEEELQAIHNDLERKVLERTTDLEKTNATLAMMLDYARKTETDIQERVVANLRANILGIVGVLKKQQLEKSTQDLVELLETTTLHLAHPLARNLESQLLKLSAREMQLANFIRLGKSTKELVELLNISKKTVDSHRDNLRKKLGIHNKKINLRTFLNSEFAK